MPLVDASPQEMHLLAAQGNVLIFAAEQEYRFMINGAFLAEVDYDSIRVASSDPDFPEIISAMLEHGCRMARVRYAAFKGPIYA